MPRVEPEVTVTGLITGVYTAVFATSLWGTAVYGVGTVSTFFGLAAAATIVLTQLEQEFARDLIGDRASEYVLRCDSLTGNCNVKAGYIGTAPRNATIWELPSSIGQLMGMTCTFWTLFLLRVVAKNHGGEDKLSYSDGGRLLALWSLCIATVGFAVYHRFVSPMQGSLGIVIGSGIGVAAYWSCDKLEIFDR